MSLAIRMTTNRQNTQMINFKKNLDVRYAEEILIEIKSFKLNRKKERKHFN